MFDLEDARSPVWLAILRGTKTDTRIAILGAGVATLSFWLICGIRAMRFARLSVRGMLCHVATAGCIFALLASKSSEHGGYNSLPSDGQVETYRVNFIPWISVFGVTVAYNVNGDAGFVDAITKIGMFSCEHLRVYSFRSSEELHALSKLQMRTLDVRSLEIDDVSNSLEWDSVVNRLRLGPVLLPSTLVAVDFSDSDIPLGVFAYPPSLRALDVSDRELTSDDVRILDEIAGEGVAIIGATQR